MFKKYLKDQRGISMISVIAAFVILMMGILMTAGAITTAARVSGEALQMQKDTDAAVAAYYQETGDCSSDKVTITIRQKKSPAEGLAQFEGAQETYIYTSPMGKTFSLHSFRSVNHVEEAEE